MSEMKDVQTLKEFINKYFSGHQGKFAKAHNVTKQLVNQWLLTKEQGKDFIVVDDKMYLYRRDLNKKQAPIEHNDLGNFLAKKRV